MPYLLKPTPDVSFGMAALGFTESSQIMVFTPYERTGVIVMAAAGIISCTLVSTLLLSIVLSVLPSWSEGSPDISVPFVRRQIAVFVICLLVSDLIQSVSGLTQVKWASENRLYAGTACSIQAGMLLMGDLGSTVWSGVIAAHTFSCLALGRQWSRKLVFFALTSGWVLVIFLTLIGPVALATDQRGPFFSLAGTWCFISSEYAVARLTIHYIPIFVAAVIIVVLYVLVFFVMRGNIGFVSHPSQDSTVLPLSDMLDRRRTIVAKRILWYPGAYLTCILPIAVTRLMGFEEETVPEGVWIFGMFFLFSLGAVDAVIYASTRQIINPRSLPVHMKPVGPEHRSATAITTLKDVYLGERDYPSV